MGIKGLANSSAYIWQIQYLMKCSLMLTTLNNVETRENYHNDPPFLLLLFNKYLNHQIKVFLNVSVKN